jgi:hypothetical protein
LLKGSVEDVVLTGRDLDGKVPRLAEKNGNGDLRFSYDLVNLDFEGGAGYRSTGRQNQKASGGQRIEAVRKIIDRQRGKSFVFFWTVNVRDTLGDEPLHYLKDYAKRIKNNSLQEIIKTVEQNIEGLKHHQLKAWIPLFIKEEAEIRQFNCHCYPPIVYEGHEKAKMVHFAFLLQFINDRQLRVSSKQDEERVVRLPMVEAFDSRLKFAEEQYLALSKTNCSSELKFLDEKTYVKIMSTYRNIKTIK